MQRWVADIQGDPPPHPPRTKRPPGRFVVYGLEVVTAASDSATGALVNTKPKAAPTPYPMTAAAIEVPVPAFRVMFQTIARTRPIALNSVTHKPG